MHLEILVEEPSAEVALRAIVPRIIGADHTFDLHPHQGKPDLLRKLPGRLRGYRSYMPQDWRIVVLVDEDRQDCHALKARLEKSARDAGLSTQSAPRRSGVFQVLNRIALEELEAWFLGDPEAVAAAFPRVPPIFTRKAPLRDPDGVKGGTFEALERVLQQHGYSGGGLGKIDLARAVAEHMRPERNRSKSFRVFRAGLERLLAPGRGR